MLDARFRPMPKWTRQPELQFRRDQFRTSYTRTLDILEYEIGQLCGSDIRIEAGYTIDQLRNDGWPKGNQVPSHPGVVLYFETEDKGALCFPAGTYDSMQANLHAIALTLESLRAIDRYGVTLQHEQYRGFVALPPAGETSRDAAELIARINGVSSSPESVDAILNDCEFYRTAYRHAAGIAHPDKATGSHGLFIHLSGAKRILDQHHGLAAAVSK